MKECYVQDMNFGNMIESKFMVFKKLYKQGNTLVAFIGDKTGDFKVSIEDKENILEKGSVIDCKFVFSNLSEIIEFQKVQGFNLEDYLPSIDRPIEEIMEEIENMSKEEFKSEECISLNKYFFNDEEFLKKFKQGIGGVNQHHNYIGGLAEHTLNVMYIAKMLSYRYNANNKEIAILAAKLHDIGKVYELDSNGPFSYTLMGEMEGHIVIAIEMLNKAFNSNEKLYSEDFKQRIKACIIQHHGKVEYGSPRAPKLEEAYIVHYADYIDANMNKISIVKKGVEKNTWSQYDRRIESRLYI